MERFRRYEESFQNSCRIVERNSKNLESGNGWGKYDALVSLTVSTEDEISEAEAFLAALDSETQSMSLHERQLPELRVEECRDDFKRILTQFNQAVANAEKNFIQRAKAPSSSSSSSSSSTFKGGSGSVAARTTFEMTTGSLEDSQRIIAQTDDIGAGTLQSLERQRYMLVNAGDNVSGTRSATGMAGVILTQMANRAFRWKLFLVFMILLQFACIVLVIYYGFGAGE